LKLVKKEDEPGNSGNVREEFQGGTGKDKSDALTNQKQRGTMKGGVEIIHKCLGRKRRESGRVALTTKIEKRNR